MLLLGIIGGLYYSIKGYKNAPMILLVSWVVFGLAPA